MKRFGLILLALATLVSCDKLNELMNRTGDGSEKGKIEFPDGSGLMLDENGAGTLRMTATHAWTSVIDWQGSGEGWLTMEPTSADEGGDFDIHFTANSQPEPGQTRGVEVVFQIADHKFRANVTRQRAMMDIYISSVRLSHTGTLNLKVGEHVEVYATYEPADATVVDLHWTKPDGTAEFDIVSNNPLQATIHGQRPGRATLTVLAKTATGYDGPSATLDVAVVE